MSQQRRAEILADLDFCREVAKSMEELGFPVIEKAFVWRCSPDTFSKRYDCRWTVRGNGEFAFELMAYEKDARLMEMRNWLQEIEGSDRAAIAEAIASLAPLTKQPRLKVVT